MNKFLEKINKICRENKKVAMFIDMDGTITVYDIYPEEIESYLKAGKYVEEEVVVDGHIITSRGPATAFAFAYKLLDVLGIDSSSLKHGMLYDLYR